MEMENSEKINGIGMQGVSGMNNAEKVQEKSASDVPEQEEAAAKPAEKSMMKADGTVISRDGDTLSISHNNVSSTGTLANAGNSVSAFGITSDDTDGSDGTDTDDLSQYTETELKNMLDAGDITQKEYDDEIESRDMGNTSAGSGNIMENFDTGTTGNTDKGE